MDLTTQRRCLSLLAGGLFAGTLAAVVWSFSAVPKPQPLSSAASGDGVNDNGPSDSSDTSPEGTIPPVTLRRPLIDTPAPAPAPEPRQPPPVQPPPRSTLDLTLVGTIIDPLQSFAIVVDPSGKFDVKGVGESLELEPAGVRIQSIESEQVTLEYRGSTSTFKLDRSKKAAKRAGAKNRGGLGGLNNRERRNRP